MSQIREEFEKAFVAAKGLKFPMMAVDDHASSLWAAKWMAERCAEIADKRGPVIGGFSLISSSELRQLAKELSNE